MQTDCFEPSKKPSKAKKELKDDVELYMPFLTDHTNTKLLHNAAYRSKDKAMQIILVHKLAQVVIEFVQLVCPVDVDENGQEVEDAPGAALDEAEKFWPSNSRRTNTSKDSVNTR